MQVKPLIITRVSALAYSVWIVDMNISGEYSAALLACALPKDSSPTYSTERDEEYTLGVIVMGCCYWPSGSTVDPATPGTRSLITTERAVGD
ncbi:hypothetical protein PM082_006262 [Marasmius tenuissimus]|nr:hypothetical protein PM082_006262 [Marasmius tenuissimus]